jgi:hypothetical protein
MTSELLEKQYLEKRTTDIGNANETKKSTTILPKVCWLVMRCTFCSLSAENTLLFALLILFMVCYL